MKTIIEKDFYDFKVFARKKYPRKLKKKLKKMMPLIPVGSWCYGYALGNMKKGKLIWESKTIFCPFFHDRPDDPELGKMAYCDFLKVKTDNELTDQVKICLGGAPFLPYLIKDGDPASYTRKKPDWEIKYERKHRLTRK